MLGSAECYKVLGSVFTVIASDSTLWVLVFKVMKLANIGPYLTFPSKGNGAFNI